MKRINSKFRNKETANDQLYVDLDLPSGLKWAKCNVGSEKETDYGYYFMCGSTEPNTASQCIWKNAPFNGGNSVYDANAFNSVKDTVCPNRILAKEYDAATQIMGDEWRMPTASECQELIDNTTKEWTTINEVNGYKFTGSNGNSIFIPAAGYYYGGSVYDVGDSGNVWSSLLRTSYPQFAWSLDFYSGGCGMSNYYRCVGQSVRGVMD